MTDNGADKSWKWQNILEWFNWKNEWKIQKPNDPNETGVDRLVNAWYSFNRGEKSFESLVISNGIAYSALFGLLFGGMLSNRQVYQSFIEKHNSNVFHGHREANRLLNDMMYLEFFRMGIKSAIRYGLFCGTMIGGLTLVSTYRNDIYFRDCMLSSSLTGAICRAHLGPRAMLLTATLGALFGGTFAAIMKLYLKLNGTTFKELRYDCSSMLAEENAEDF